MDVEIAEEDLLRRGDPDVRGSLPHGALGAALHGVGPGGTADLSRPVGAAEDAEAGGEDQPHEGCQEQAHNDHDATDHGVPPPPTVSERAGSRAGRAP